MIDTIFIFLDSISNWLFAKDGGGETVTKNKFLLKIPFYKQLDAFYKEHKKKK